jgi:xylulokinase
MTLLLGLDYGTTGFKAGLFDLAGRAVAQTGGELGVQHPQVGWVEQDAHQAWEALSAAIRRLLSQAQVAPESVAAIAATGSSHLTLLDAAGRVLRPAILYGDTRIPSTEESASIVAALGEARVAGAFGLQELDDARLTMILRVMRSARLLWLRAHEPQIFASIHTCLSSSADFIAYQLTGLATSLAGGPRLDDDIAALFDLPTAWFGQAMPTGAVLGQVTAEAAATTGLAPGTPVVMTGIDSLVAFLGMGLAAPELAANLAGTTDVVALTLDHSPRGGPGYALAHLIPNLWLLSLSPVRGPALRWFRDTFLSPAAGYAEMDTLAAHAPPGAEGLLFLPYLAGEKGIVHDPQARGVLVGLDTRHTTAHIARALLEGVAFGVREILDVYQASGAAINAVRLAGGGARSRLWNQIKANVLGRPVEVLETAQVGCLGSAMLAAVAIGQQPDRQTAANQMARIATHLEFEPAQRERYQALYGLYQQLYPANRAVLTSLARWRS